MRLRLFKKTRVVLRSGRLDNTQPQTFRLRTCYIVHTHYYLERLRAAKRRSQKMLLLSYRSMRRFDLMPNGLGEGCEVGAWAPTSTTTMTHSILETLKRAHIDSTRFARQHAVPSPSRPRPTTNAIGAGRRHATVSCEASAPLLCAAVTTVRWLS